ncbi:cation diffusion facilitator family transporter [Seiridium cupressi]
MALSKSARISIMLAIDAVFFLIELIAGLVVHSLALTADAFHMLNDIISLAVGLWAVRISTKQSTDKFSYGWVRAEILGGFFNAVFLIALCISIILESITRFIDPPEITNPQIILIVGCCGLVSNLVGFVVLGHAGHDHGHEEHSHDGAKHGHVHNHDEVAAAEEGRAATGDGNPAGEDGPATDIFPEVAIARASAPASSPDTVRRIHFDNGDAGHPSEHADRSQSRSSASRGREQRKRTGSLKHSRLQSIEDHSFHPASFRQNIIDHGRSSVGDIDDSSTDGEAAADENTPLIQNGNGGVKNGHSHADEHKGRSGRGRRDSGVHREHNHSKLGKSPKSGGHGHNHADMGMHAMILHVIGDALGNVGVIVTALIIWLTDLSWKYYADPAVSLFITAIILSSAVPLTKASAKVLLQATPDEIDITHVKEDIQELDGVISCHHVHVWRLSDTKIVASMHVQVAFPASQEGGASYMNLMKQARKCLHGFGIHSATIQPEFCLDEECNHDEPAASAPRCTNAVAGQCLLGCTDDCVAEGCCSVPQSQNGGGSIRSTHSDHSHH